LWVAVARKISTNGSASPSLSPDSTFSRRRNRSGTSARPTIAAANTGSVGDRIAPTRNAVGQSSPARKCAGTATPTIVSGIASPSARPDSRHASRRAGKQAR
jgi:hypothetical protein